MQFSTAIFALAAFVATTQACQCHDSNGVDSEATRQCCASAGGTYQDSGSQCPAGEISEHLSTFYSCCRSYGESSDCDCPSGCAAEVKAKRDAGITLSDRDVEAIMAKYH